jgi:hypothetical protein
VLLESFERGGRLCNPVNHLIECRFEFVEWYSQVGEFGPVGRGKMSIGPFAERLNMSELGRGLRMARAQAAAFSIEGTDVGFESLSLSFATRGLSRALVGGSLREFRDGSRSQAVFVQRTFELPADRAEG